tara:strand:+ start:107 stop:634 length:528 start_codon:yes stop_codon:yes gene_type:complete
MTSPKKLTVDFVGDVLDTLATKKFILDDNIDKALEHIPESFSSVDMLFISCKINDNDIPLFIDTGAAISVMPKSVAVSCGLSDLIDQRYQGKLIGVGTQKIYGKVYYVDIIIEDFSIPCSFTIVDDKDDVETPVIFGLDMLHRHGCCLDIGGRKMIMGGKVIPFIRKKTFLPKST